MQAVTIGLDVAKSLFQVHGIDAQGNVVIRRQLERRQTVPLQEASTLLIGIDACVRDIEVVITIVEAPMRKVMLLEGSGSRPLSGIGTTFVAAAHAGHARGSLPVVVRDPGEASLCCWRSRPPSL